MYRDSFSIQLASDGLKAIAVLKKSVVSLVITEFKMSGMDDLELLTHIKEHYPDISVIFITGCSTLELGHFAQ